MRDVGPLEGPFTFVILLGGLIMAVALWRELYGRFRRQPAPPGTWSGVHLLGLGFALMFASGLGYAAYAGSVEGRLNSCKSTLGKSIGTALEMYADDHEGVLPSSLSELTPNYLKSIPRCSAAGKDTYSGGYRRLQGDETGRPRWFVACQGRNHRGAGLLSADQPAYHSELGLLPDDRDQSPRLVGPPDVSSSSPTQQAVPLSPARRDVSPSPGQQVEPSPALPTP